MQPVMVVCAGVLTIATTCNCFHFSGVTWRSGSAEWIANITADSSGHLEGCCWLCCCVVAKTYISDGSMDRLPVVTQAYYANFAMHHPQGSLGFFFSVEPLSNIPKLVLWFLLSTLRFWCGCSLHQWELNCLGLHHNSSLEHSHDKNIYALCCFLAHTRGASSSHSSNVWRSWMLHVTQTAVAKPSMQIIGYTALVAQQIHLMPPPSYLEGRGPLF